MMKNESMRLVTFKTEESTEESKKSTEESKNGWRNNGGREEEEHYCSELQNVLSSGSGRKKETAGIYRGTFSSGWWLQPGLKVTFQPRAQPRPRSRPLLPVGATNRE